MSVGKAQVGAAKAKTEHGGPIDDAGGRLETRVIGVDQRPNGTICGAEAVFTFDAAIAGQVAAQMSELHVRNHGLGNACALLARTRSEASERASASKDAVEACSIADGSGDCDVFDVQAGAQHLCGTTGTGGLEDVEEEHAAGETAQDTAVRCVHDPACVGEAVFRSWTDVVRPCADVPALRPALRPSSSLVRHP